MPHVHCNQNINYLTMMNLGCFFAIEMKIHIYLVYNGMENSDLWCSFIQLLPVISCLQMIHYLLYNVYQ